MLYSLNFIKSKNTFQNCCILKSRGCEFEYSTSMGHKMKCCTECWGRSAETSTNGLEIKLSFHINTCYIIESVTWNSFSQIHLDLDIFLKAHTQFHMKNLKIKPTSQVTGRRETCLVNH